MPSLPNEPDLPFTPLKSKRKFRKKKKKGVITANVSGTKYEIVRIVIEEMLYVKARDDDETANIVWNDCAVQHEKITELRNYQRINHFPGMGEICRKDCLARNMTKMIKCQPQEYNFVPRTWIFPAEYTQFQTYVKELKRKKKTKTFIIKPANGAMGHGISLTRNGEKLQAQDHLIVQEYIDKPFLMEGYKFDLRIYILVTSCDPLRIFIYNDGLVRMGTESYNQPSESNLNKLYMHLTNYSVNKHNENFERDETENRGSKRSIRWFMEFLRSNDHDVTKFWNDVSELVVKTLIVAEPHVLHAYRMCRPGQHPTSESVCFEVLGFDILLDKKLKPWLLEINRAPSFGTDQKIDYDVKKGVLLNALKLLNIRASDKKKNLAKQKAEAQKRLYGQGPLRRLSPGSSDWEKQRHTLERRKEELKERLCQVRKQISREEYENRNLGNYRRIYPPDDKLLLEKYEGLLATAFQTFLAGRAATLQREMNNPLKRMKIHQHYVASALQEEDILDLLEQCELDDEKLMGKSTRQKEPRALSSMPESIQASRKQKNSSSSDTGGSDSRSGSETEQEDENRRKEKHVSYDLEEHKFKSLERSSRYHYQPPIKSRPFIHASSPSSTTPIRRSVSCPRSITALNAQSPVPEQRSFSSKIPSQIQRPASGNRTNSLNRNSSSNRLPATSTCSGLYSSVNESGLHHFTKEQEDDLTRQTLAVLRDLRIRFPGKVEEETCSIIEEIMDNWRYHKPKLASYWLIKLDSVTQRKILDIVRTNIWTVLQRIWKVSDVECLQIYRSFNRVFNRLLWSHGQGLWSCFCSSGNSWEPVISRNTEMISRQQVQCCQRLVQLCKECLLVVYKYATDSRGVNTDRDDTRYLLPVLPQFTMKTSSSSLGCGSSGPPRSTILFTSQFKPY
ncbi:tubulin polyglutamylase TTLL7 isoform X2 [Pelobates fuscus]|uniref:tubulin polyglutamylase TTLL7 isoform X2 n=1 Tax=Pelobates fuscus TaxID=191477 RepID=UPI002FE45A5F